MRNMPLSSVRFGAIISGRWPNSSPPRGDLVAGVGHVPELLDEAPRRLVGNSSPAMIFERSTRAFVDVSPLENKRTAPPTAFLPVERAYEVAAKHADLFDVDNPADAFVITDDFMSAGRISGALSIPIPQLKVGQFHTVSGSRLQVNESSCGIAKNLSI